MSSALHVSLRTPWPVLELGTVDSTMQEAKRRISAGLQEEVLICARAQNAGRGRQGRIWVSPPGNLYASVLLRPRIARTLWAQYGFAAGLALAESIGSFLSPASRVSLKWPNDVLVERLKVAGFLLETEHTFLLLGLGVNLVSHPVGSRFPAGHIGQFPQARTPTVSSLLLSFGHALHRWCARWQTEGFSVIRRHWLALSEGLGEPIRVSPLPGKGKEKRGVFRGLSADGALLLEDSRHGTQKIYAGEIFFPTMQEGVDVVGR